MTNETRSVETFNIPVSSAIHVSQLKIDLTLREMVVPVIPDLKDAMDLILSRVKLRLGETNNSIMIEVIIEQDRILLRKSSFLLPGVRLAYWRPRLDRKYRLLLLTTSPSNTAA